MEFAAKVRNLLKVKGLTQIELAECIGTSQQVVSRWLEGNTPPKAAYLLKLARSLGVTADYLIDDDQDEPTAAAPGPVLSDDEGRVLWLFRSLAISAEEAARRLASVVMVEAEAGGKVQPVRTLRPVARQDLSETARREAAEAEAQKQGQEEKRRLGFELEADCEAAGRDLNPFPRRRG